MNDYIAQAQQTLSPQWHGNMVDIGTFKNCLERAIAVANEMDAIKKALFYGRFSNGLLQGDPSVPDALVTPLSEEFVSAQIVLNGANPLNIIHGIIGQFTESGELLEALRQSLFGLELLDAVNLREEIGDSLWYHAILLHECSKEGLGFTFEDAMRINIEKLRARFPDKFTEYDANNRDLASERKILEDKA